ncbi:MAG TPA: SDR family oxidoreductase [Burkholderiales bacterium]|nr:SDR family oxidoreductase [Burkholderiales bacterium]
MELGLKNRAVLITGGSKGIGLACACAFLDEGARIAIVSRDRRNLDKAAAQLGKVATIVADLVQADEAKRMAREAEAELGPIDILVNSAGAAKRYPPDELNAQSWHAAMDAKYFTYIHAMDAVLPSMRDRKRGNVVNIIGTGGKVASSIHLPGGAANSALMLASVGLAGVYGRFGVRINAINPGATITDRIREALELEATAKGTTVEQVLEQGQARVPLGRYADPREIASVTLFLASDQAAYVTGAVIPMDGGINPII